VGDGHSHCNAYQIAASFRVVSSVLATVFAVVVLSVFFGTFGSIRQMVNSTENVAAMLSRRRARIIISVYFFIHLLLPVVDLLTDLNYLLENLFFSPAMYYVMVVYFIFAAVIMPFYLLMKRLIEYGAWPRIHYRQNRLIWLCFAKYKYTNHSSTQDGEHWNFAPHFYTDTWRSVSSDYSHDPSMVLIDDHQGRQLCWLAATDHMELGSAILNLFLILLYLVLQILSIPMYFVLLLLQLILIPIWFFIGAILLWTKVDAMGTVWTTWFYYWTATDDFAAVFEDPNTVIDTEVFNGSMFMHCFFHSIPHILLQVINNSLIRKPWKWYAILSVLMSGYLIASGVYIFMYHRFCGSLGVHVAELKDVPQVLSVIGFKILTLTPAEKIRPVKVRRDKGAPSPDFTTLSISPYPQHSVHTNVA